MRVARYFPLVVLAGFVAPVAMTRTTFASDSAAVVSTDDPSDQLPRGRMIDPSVQQANFYDSRPRPNSTSIDGESNGQHKGALFQGNSWSLSNMLFGRRSASGSQPQAKQTQSQQQPNQSQPSNSNKSWRRPPNQDQSTVNARPMQNRAMMPANGQSQSTQRNASTTSSANRNAQTGNWQNNPNSNRPAVSNRPPMPMAAEYNPRPVSISPRPMPLTASEPPTPNMTSVSPWSAATIPAAKSSAPATTAAAAPSRPAAPMTPADRLVAEAHALSTSAKTEQDYSRIIETCRRAQASQCSPETAKYAGNLTAWAFNRRGQLKAEAGHDKDAILDFDDAIRTDATCWRAVHNRGVLLAQAGQFEKAFDDFTRTIQLNPQFAKAYSNRAALFMVANNLNAAEQDYNRAIELDANLAVAHRGCGRCCQLLGRLDQAINHYDAAVQLAPNDAYAAACRADLLTDIGRYADALAEYNRALQIDPKSTQANCGSAWLLATCPDSALRNPQLALQRAKQAIEMGGQKDAISYDSLAAAEANAGNFTAAVQSINKAIELAPVDERDAYKDRQVLYQQAKPYRIAPVDRVAQQASYETR